MNHRPWATALGIAIIAIATVLAAASAALLSEGSLLGGGGPSWELMVVVGVVPGLIAVAAFWAGIRLLRHGRGERWLPAFLLATGTPIALLFLGLVVLPSVLGTW